MTSLLVWIIMAYGMSNILVYGSIFNAPRALIHVWADSNMPMNSFGKFLKDMLSCMMCSSTWVGFFFGLFAYSPTHEFLDISKYGSWFLDGMVASGSVWAINSIIEWFEENRPNKNVLND